ncbi:MAG TPA: ferredoxin [Candidatus Bipolaricaulota bacterium]|nr:ferredoxin [Candidatus Bipolaricaulota bacterium]
MIPKVDQTKCIGCGFCVGVAPEVFQLNAEGKSEIIGGVDFTAHEAKIKEAAAGCPVSAITIE